MAQGTVVRKNDIKVFYEVKNVIVQTQHRASPMYPNRIGL